MDRRLQAPSVMVRFPTVLGGFVVCVVGVVGLQGCGDHASDLDAARKAKAKPTPSASGAPTVDPLLGATPPPGGVTPVGATTPQPTGACAPQVVNVTMPAWRPPSPRRAVCTQAEGQNLVNCYIGQQQAACDAQVNVECHRCVVSDPTIDATFGPIVFDQARPTEVELNVEGCAAALSGDTSANGCGPRIRAAELCKSQACAACTDPNQKAICMQAAATGSCAQYVQGAAPCQQFYQQCAPGNPPNWIQVGYQLTQLFCM